MIEVADLVFRYPGGERDAVAGISFEVDRGELKKDRVLVRLGQR